MLTPTYQLSAYSERRGLVGTTPSRRCRSFVQQFLQLLYLGLQDGANFNVTQIGGSGVSVIAREPFRMSITGAGRGGSSSSFHLAGQDFITAVQSGIVVGTGTNAVAVTNSALQTPVADGTGSGQLEYLSCAITNYRITRTTQKKWKRSKRSTNSWCPSLVIFWKSCDLFRKQEALCSTTA